MTDTTTRREAGTDPRSRTLARWGVAGGLIGATQAAVLSFWPAQVPPDMFSYPHTPTGAAVAQVTFALQHLLLLAGLVALLGSARGRLLRAGLWAAAAAMVVFAAQELVAIVAAGERADSAVAGTVEALYGIPTVALGLALVVAGVGALRGGVLPGSRWLLLVTGLFVFVALTPALMGPFEVARIAIGVWMLLFAWLFTAPARA